MNHLLAKYERDEERAQQHRERFAESLAEAPPFNDRRFAALRYQARYPHRLTDLEEQYRHRHNRSYRRRAMLSDQMACYLCGTDLEDAAIHVDHIIPIAHGGTHDLHNLALTCQSCTPTEGSTPRRVRHHLTHPNLPGRTVTDDETPAPSPSASSPRSEYEAWT